MLGILVLLVSSFSIAPIEMVDFCKISCNGSKVKVCAQLWKCDPKKPCQAIKQDRHFRSSVTTAHNEIRNEVALGKTHLPAAHNMTIMNYDRHLEFVSSCYANTCKMAYNDCNKTDINGPIGQTTYMHPVDKKPHPPLDQIVLQWKLELQNISVKEIKKSTGGQRNNITQIIWETSNKVGCAQSTDNKFIYTYCSYSMKCCTKGQRAYVEAKKKKVCQKCLCNNNFKGLCDVIFSPNPSSIASSHFIVVPPYMFLMLTICSYIV